MAFWNVDQDSYRKAYEEAVDAFRSLPMMGVSVTAPELIANTEDYERSEPRLLILGQETGQNSNKIDDRPSWEISSAAFGSYIHFNMALGTDKERTPFWQAYREACSIFRLSQRGAAWANLSVVNRDDGVATSYISLPFEQQIILADWQKSLFAAMLKFVRPNYVLAFTGPDYDGLLKRMLPDLALEAVDETPVRQLASGTSRKFGLKLVRTYHPGYLIRDPEGERWKLLRTACKRLLMD